MGVIAAFFGLDAPYALTSHAAAFSHYFKRLDRSEKLATSSIYNITLMLPRSTTTQENRIYQAAVVSMTIRRSALGATDGQAFISS